MTVAKNKVVSFTYCIVDQQGQIFEQSDLPMDYIHGVDNDMFPKVEHALEGKSPGDTVEVTLTPDEAFGQPDPNLIIVDDVNNAPPEYRYVGAKPVFQNDRGELLEMTVTHVDDKNITIDGNNPLCGKTVTFKLTVTDIRDATDEELQTGLSGPSWTPM